MDKYSEPIAPAPPARILPGASAIALGCLLLERIGYYGFRGVAYGVITTIFTRHDGQGIPYLSLMSGLYVLTFMLPGILGIVTDTMLSKRVSMALGGVIAGIGTLLVLAGDSFLLGLGLSLLTVGSSLVRPASLGMLGMVGVQAPAGMGLAWFIGAVVNLGIFMGVNLLAQMDGIAPTTLALIAAGVMFIQSVLAIAGILTGALPPDHKLLERPARSTGATLGGLLVVIAVIAFGYFLIDLPAIGISVETRRWFLDVPFGLLVVAASIGVMASGKSDLKHLAPILLSGACIFLLMFIFDFGWQVLRYDEFFETWGWTYNWLLAFPPIIVGTVAGVITLTFPRRLGTSNVAAIAVAAGILLVVAASSLGLQFSGMEVGFLLLAIGLSSIGEGLYMPMTWGITLGHAPRSRTGTASGFLLACGGLAGTFASMLKPSNAGYADAGVQPVQYVILWAALVLSAIAAILLVITVLRASRAQQQESQDPFA